MRIAAGFLAALVLSGCTDVPQKAPLTGPVLTAASFEVVAFDVVRAAQQACRLRHVDRGHEACNYEVVRLPDRDLPPNAWQTRDGAGRSLIVITENLVAALENPDELAFVLAHEAAHHVAGHQKLALAEHGQRLAILLSGGTVSAPLPPDAPELEFEADALGAEIAARAGYDAKRASALFNRHIFWHDQSDDDSHPSGASRRARLLAGR